MTRYLKPGDRVTVEMPCSEVCMHMRVAGKAMQVEIVGPNSAQLYTLDGTPFSAPVTLGEAGIYSDAEGHYCYPVTL